jgi:hypothetical protein
MTYFFCNIGWMEFYEGQSSNDTISGGGSYVKKEGRGHEVCNFLPYRKKLYGYVQPSGEHIDIERLGAEPAADFVDGVTVIWTASHPQGGSVIIGWYKNATIYREYQEFDKASSTHAKNGVDGYRISANAESCKLLPIDQRTFEIPRRVKGGMGQANIWYADTEEAKPLLREVKKVVTEKRATAAKKRSKKTDPERNIKVEKSAINVVTKQYEKLGYTVDSVEKDNIGWDLEATSGKRKLLIEVKGLSGTAQNVELTPNEFRAFEEQNESYRLCVVSDALGSPTLSVCRYSAEKSAWIVEGNESASIRIQERRSASIEVRI